MLLFSAMLLIVPKAANKGSDSSWIWLAFAAFFCWGFLSIAAKIVLNQGLSPIALLFYIHLIVSLVIAVRLQWKERLTPTRKVSLVVLAGVGLFSAIFNVAMLEALASAPNIGYVNSINASSISVVTLLSIWLFKDEKSVRKLIGVVGIIIGLIVILAV